MRTRTRAFMAANSTIEWTNHTFNPWWGCTKVSPACDHCYAETWAKRTGHDIWGHGAQRRRLGDEYWNQPLRWNRAAARNGRRARVFCASMADVFEANRDLDGLRRRLWVLIERTPHLDWLLLTKRPRMAPLLAPWDDDWPKHVWLGATVENQRLADQRIPSLLEIPCRYRFLSCERVYSMRGGFNRPARAERGFMKMSHPAIDKSIYLWPTRNEELPSLPYQKLKLAWRQRRKPEIGLLSAAYLSVFSLLGVEFAKANALTKVRRQIVQPDADYFRDFCFVGEDVGRAVYIVYTRGHTCWGVTIDGHLMLLPSVEANEWNPTLDDLLRSSALKKFTHTFGADRRFLFQEIHRVPVESLTDDVRQGVRQVGSLGWDMRVRQHNRIVGNYVSVGRDQDSLWFLEYHQ